MTSKSERQRQNPSWGPESEIKFIDGLGTHRQKEHCIERTDRKWLEMYITSHQNSRHYHHKIGVNYAKEKLEKQYGQKSTGN